MSGVLHPVGDVDAETLRSDLCLDRTWAGFDGDTVASAVTAGDHHLDAPPAQPGFPADRSGAGRVGGAGDLTLDVAVLGAVYLGGYGVHTLAAAGPIDEHYTNAVTKADAMIRSP